MYIVRMNDTVVDSHQALNLCASSGITLLEAYSFKTAAVQYDIHNGTSGDKAEKCSIASHHRIECRVKFEDLRSASDVQCKLYSRLAWKNFVRIPYLPVNSHGYYKFQEE